jgi:hypothetical protein
MRIRTLRQLEAAANARGDYEDVVVFTRAIRALEAVQALTADNAEEA